MKNFLVLGVFYLLIVAAAKPAEADTRCGGSDCIVYDLSGQDTCSEVTAGPSYDIRWATLGRSVDQAVKGGRIVAYQIQWGGGTWSPWYVPGVNDIDTKFNTGTSTLRRVWSYFYDHNHKYIICTKTPGAY